MEPTREIKKNGYVYILNTNKRQYRCASCSSTFSIDSYCTRSGHSSKCRNSKTAKKSAKKTAEMPSLFLIKKGKKMSHPSVPLRNPTKHFKKDKTPSESSASIEEDQFSLSKEIKHEEECDKSSLPTSNIIDCSKDIKATLDRIDQRRRENHLKNKIKVNKKK